MREGLLLTRAPTLAVQDEQTHSMDVFSRHTQYKGSRRSPRLDEDEMQACQGVLSMGAGQRWILVRLVEVGPPYHRLEGTVRVWGMARDPG